MNRNVGEVGAMMKPIRSRFISGYALTAVVMFVLKWHYSRATAESLLWVLWPVARLTALAGGADFEWEAGIGFVRADQAMIIAPACAGLNFMIMGIGLGVMPFVHRLSGRRHLLKWLAGAWVGAYALTIAVNSIRILLAVHLFDAHAAWGWLTAERLHRVTGIAVYFTALGLYYGGLARIITAIERQNMERVKFMQMPWLPWVWYVGGAVAVPVVHQLARGRSLPGWEHCLTVVGISSALWGVGIAALRIAKRRCRSGG